ncbi:hypothetical protein F2Q69_00003314 [Brassica cretica]|uniref:Serine/arginine repetitive matrix protein 1-like n=1 Tax=Brassica cretica TaxID=69181 RepID=A0A8S9NS52_BRACR|nr:hypothetical protein F2Q69_00003314 [Brassica cretica]
MPEPLARRKMSPGRPEIAREEASSTKKTTATPLRRSPSPEPPQNLPAEVLNEARAEHREVMTQYTSCADPSESAARKERLRQAEQNGQLEESVALMACASLENLHKRNLDVTQHASPERIPALLRLGSPNSPRISPEPDLPDSPQRTPTLLRLGKHLSPSHRSQSASSPGRPQLQNQKRTSYTNAAPTSKEDNRNGYHYDRERDQNFRSSDRHGQAPRRNNASCGKSINTHDSHRRRHHPYAHNRQAPRDSRDSRDSRDFRVAPEQRSSKPPSYRQSYRPLQVQDAQLPPPPARQPRSRPSDRRSPSPEPPQNLPAEVLNEARAELREVMTQYTSCADPSESAARKERLRQAEQNGQLEESVALMARASLANLPKRNLDVTQRASPERIPALLRLGSPNSPRISLEQDLPDSPQRTQLSFALGNISLLPVSKRPRNVSQEDPQEQKRSQTAQK